jgi:hypothetical protein
VKNLDKDDKTDVAIGIGVGLSMGVLTIYIPAIAVSGIVIFSGLLTVYSRRAGRLQMRLELLEKK